MVYAGMNFQKMNMETVIVNTIETLGVTREQFESKSRKRFIVEARQIAMYLVRTHCKKYSLADIGLRMGNKDHATVLHGVRVMTGYMDERFGDAAIKEKIQLVSDSLQISLGINPEGQGKAETVRTYLKKRNKNN